VRVTGFGHVRQVRVDGRAVGTVHRITTGLFDRYTAGAHTVGADEQVLETFRADDDGGDGYIADIEILRGDLSQVLYDDTRDGVEYLFGDRIAELTQDADGVDVAFAGSDRRRFDLVVGADGLHSALRAMVFGPHERSSATSGTCWPSTSCPTSSSWTAGCSLDAAQDPLIRSMSSSRYSRTA
jgi:2-polyprenyl-6-methoxyphenol hydroxylase-like FAD-dependent oxidoreductase